VPIAFAGGGEDSAPPASQATIQTGQTATSSFTVIPAESRLTSPKRLAHRRPLDPFRQSPSGGSAGVEGSGGKEQGGSTGGESAPTETGSSGSAEEIAPLPESGGGETPAEVTKTTESTTTESTETVVAPQTIAYAIDLKTGFDPKNLQEQSEVAAMTKLPNKKNPALLYVGLSPDKKKALFLMTSRVTAYYGAAQCSLDKQACELIELTPGKSASFAIGYGEEPAIYKVLLKGIEPVVESLGSHSKTTKTKTKTHGKPKSRNSKSQAQSAVVGLGHAVVGH